MKQVSAEVNMVQLFEDVSKSSIYFLPRRARARAASVFRNLIGAYSGFFFEQSTAENPLFPDGNAESVAGQQEKQDQPRHRKRSVPFGEIEGRRNGGE